MQLQLNSSLSYAFLSLPYIFTSTNALNLNVTALTYRNGISILQCWSLEPPFSTPTAGGPVGASVASLGAIGGNASFIIQAPGSVGGYKNAPGPQWSIFLSGLAHITLLNSTDEAWVTGGKYGLVYADDTASVAFGHYTTFPGKDETIMLGLPVAEGKQPEHTVVREGAADGKIWQGSEDYLLRSRGI